MGRSSTTGAQAFVTLAAMKIVRRLLALLAWATLLVSILLTLVRLTAPSSLTGSLLSAEAPYAVIGYVVALLVLLVVVAMSPSGRRKIATVGLTLGVVGLVLHAIWLAPMFLGSQQAAPAGSHPLTVLTLNTSLGRADPAETIKLATDSGADLLVLEGVTSDLLAALDGDGLADLLPYRVGMPATFPIGTMVFSAEPLGDPTYVKLGQLGVRVAVAGPVPYTLIAVHNARPGDLAQWLHDLRLLRTDASTELKTHPVLLVGDFNASRDHGQFRDVEKAGLRDAAQLANSGWQPTWPSDRQVRVFGIPIPSLVALDHVLVSKQYTVQSTSTFTIKGTDHKALLAKLALSCLCSSSRPG
ncbi:MAG: hypothetical protein JWR35_864 [Marmoricola sp.]|nr:hypothetical protein [Marmoricola sp.]